MTDGTAVVAITRTRIKSGPWEICWTRSLAPFLADGQTTSYADLMTERAFPAIADLIKQAEEAAANEPDHLPELIVAIRKMIEAYPDSYSLAGVLAEGVAVTICTRIPKERRAEVAAAAVRLLYDRLRAGGAL